MGAPANGPQLVSVAQTTPSERESPLFQTAGHILDAANLDHDPQLRRIIFPVVCESTAVIERLQQLSQSERPEDIERLSNFQTLVLDTAEQTPGKVVTQRDAFAVLGLSV